MSWSDECYFFLHKIFSTEFFFKVSCTCSSNHSAYDGRCTYTHLFARTFFYCTFCLRTSAHLHACHTHAWLKFMKKVFAYVPSPFSCLTHFLLSPDDDSLSLSLDFPVQTFLPYLPVLKARGMRISARGREVWLSGQVRPQHRF